MFIVRSNFFAVIILQTNVSQRRIPAGKCKEILDNPKTQVASKKKKVLRLKFSFLLGRC